MVSELGEMILKMGRYHYLEGETKNVVKLIVDMILDLFQRWNEGKWYDESKT